MGQASLIIPLDGDLDRYSSNPSLLLLSLPALLPLLCSSITLLGHQMDLLINDSVVEDVPVRVILQSLHDLHLLEGALNQIEIGPRSRLTKPVLIIMRTMVLVSLVPILSIHFTITKSIQP